MVVGDDLEEEWIRVDVCVSGSALAAGVDLVVYRPAEGAGRSKSRRLRLGGKQEGDVRCFLVSLATRTTSFQILVWLLTSTSSEAVFQNLCPSYSQVSFYLSL